MQMSLYRDFTLRVSRIAPRTRRYRVEVYGTIPGGQPGFDEHETQTYMPERFVVEADGETVDLLERVRVRRVSASQLYQCGTILSDLLLPRSIRARLWDSLRVVRARKQRLRLRLMIEARELIPLPWEYLYLPPAGESDPNDLFFLALQPDISIVRHEVIDELEPGVEGRERYRLVAALAAPADQPRLQIKMDRSAIEQMIERISGIGIVEPTWVEMATRASLREALRQRADIFHFAGHGYFDGRNGQIILDKGDGKRSDFYNATNLAALLRGAGARLAILSACETATRADANIWGGIAPALVRAGMAAVVASQYRLKDNSAVVLTEELYRGILSGQTADEAVACARQEIYQQAGLENRDWGAPVLYLRVADGVIFPAAHAPGRAASPAQAHTIITINQNIGTVQGGTVTALAAGSIGAALVTDTPGAARPLGVPCIPPTPLQSQLVGRDDELNQTQASLRSGGKYYFYGSYGVGKTSLATELFNRAIRETQFADGYLWYRVSGMSTEQVLEQVASPFPEQDVAQVAGTAPKINALRNLLARRSNILIGLDEVRDATVARAVLEAAGSCAMILNGARRLNLGGLTQELQLEPLTPDEAEQLFLSLSSLDPATLTQQQRDLVRRICTRLRYLPLAVRLAALKQAEGESLELLWDRLREAPGTLIASDESVAAIFETLYEDLKQIPAALQLLVRIASFPAREAPLAPLRTDQRSLDFFQAKDKLVALGIVDAIGSDRLALHPVLGLGLQNAESAAVQQAREQTARWLMDYAQTNRDAYEALGREQVNLLGLLDWLADQRRWDDMVTLVRDLFDYLRVRGHWEEALQRLETILASVDELASIWKRGWVYLHHGILHLLRASYRDAASDFDRADALFAEANDQAYRGKVLYRRATLAIVSGNLALAVEQLRQAIEWMDTQALAHDRASAHERLASVLATQGDLDGAMSHYDQALALATPEEQARVHIALGELARRAGEYEKAGEHYRSALDLTTRLGHVLYQATTKQALGYMHYYQGRYDEAECDFKTAQELFQQLKYQPGLAQMLHALGNVALAHSNLDDATQYYQAALTVNLDLGQTINIAYNQYQLGLIAQRKGNPQQAETIYNQVVTAAWKTDDVALQAAALLQLSSVAITNHYPQRAHELLDQALKLADRVKDRLTTASALYYRGVMQAQEGHIETARQTLANAHAAFVALNAADASKVEQSLAELDQAQPAATSGTVPGGPLVLGVLGVEDEGKDKRAHTGLNLGSIMTMPRGPTLPGGPLVLVVEDEDKDKRAHTGLNLGSIMTHRVLEGSPFFVNQVTQWLTGEITGIEGIDRVLEGRSVPPADLPDTWLP